MGSQPSERSWRVTREKYQHVAMSELLAEPRPVSSHLAGQPRAARTRPHPRMPRARVLRVGGTDVRPASYRAAEGNMLVTCRPIGEVIDMSLTLGTATR
jgi:hypothetical protein